MKETFKINSHIYKNATVSMRTRGVFVFRKEVIRVAFDVIHTRRKKSKNPADKGNPTCKNQIVNLVILV